MAETVPEDVTSALHAVERRAAGRASRTRVFAMIVSAAAVVALVLLATGIETGRLARERPSAPPPSRAPVAANALFKVTRTLEPHALGLRHILRVAVSAKGYLVLIDSSQRVVEMTPTGHVLRTWGSPG